MSLVKRAIPITIKRLVGPISHMRMKDLQHLQNQLYRGCEPLKLVNVNRSLQSKTTQMVIGVLPSGIIVGKGTVCLGMDEFGVSARLENIVVDREYRRLKIMTRIVNELLIFARKHNPYIIHLVTRPQRKDAVAFYKKYGFKESGCKLLILPV